jgi:hypothetical protein
MTLEEATEIGLIAATVDGYCVICVDAVVDKLNKKFPQFKWEMVRDEPDYFVKTVTVKECKNKSGQ